jgi:E3 ubiquitin-protein ligase NEDD4
MILYGVPYIDVKDWKVNTDYRGEYKEHHQIVKWFWEVVSTFDQEQLARLLKFSTGSSRTPIHGFKLFSFYLENYRVIVVISQNFS